MKVWKTIARAALAGTALALTACSSSGPDPATASEPQARTQKPILAIAREPVEPVEILAEPIIEIEQPTALQSEDLAGKPQWWLDEPTWTQEEFIVTTLADAADLREARTAAVSQALAMVRETLGHDPADYTITARAQTLSGGGYRVFVRIATPRPAERGNVDG